MLDYGNHNLKTNWSIHVLLYHHYNFKRSVFFLECLKCFGCEQFNCLNKKFDLCPFEVKERKKLLSFDFGPNNFTKQFEETE